MAEISTSPRWQSGGFLPNPVCCWGTEQSPDFHRGLVKMPVWTAALITPGAPDGNRGILDGRKSTGHSEGAAHICTSL